jgi:hypothetical protein
MNILNKKIIVTGVTEPVGTGRLPPVPDMRDYTKRQGSLVFSRLGEVPIAIRREGGNNR